MGWSLNKWSPGSGHQKGMCLKRELLVILGFMVNIIEGGGKTYVTFLWQTIIGL